MKATELMIGDWVKILKFRENDIDRNVRINGILSFGSPISVNDVNSVFAVESAAIPITPEILEKNGIPTDGRTYIFDEDKQCNLELIYEKGCLCWAINFAEYIVLPFGYVHELQHALRLCGLAELADNFQI